MSATSKTLVEAARADARKRFKHLADMPDAHTAGTSLDPDNPSLSDDQLATLRPALEVHPKLVEASLRRRVGRPKADVVKKPVSLRLDPDVIEALKAKGAGWQTRANDMLRTMLGLGPE